MTNYAASEDNGNRIEILNSVAKPTVATSKFFFGPHPSDDLRDVLYYRNSLHYLGHHIKLNEVQYGICRCRLVSVFGELSSDTKGVMRIDGTEITVDFTSFTSCRSCKKRKSNLKKKRNEINRTEIKRKHFLRQRFAGFLA